MQHPLVNPSLAPYGFVFPVQAERLRFQPPEGYGVNAEKIIGRLWDQLHRSRAPTPLPIETIVHDILPGMTAASRTFTLDFEFAGKPYQSRDIAVISTVVQWFATNVGRCFLEDQMAFLEISHPEREFVEKLEYDNKVHKRDKVAFWAHTCDKRCLPQGKVVRLGADPHLYDPTTVSERDRALVHGLMWWLGKAAGRAFIAEQKLRIRRAHDAVRERELRKLRERVAA